LVALLLLVDAFVVASPAIARPGGWFPPFLAFGSVLVRADLVRGLALRHGPMATSRIVWWNSVHQTDGCDRRVQGKSPVARP
jgi:hypothetical protein